MRKLIISSIIFFLTTMLYGQEFKISLAPTINSALLYRFVTGDTPGQNWKAGLSTSFDYLFLNDKKINFGLGINYHFSQVEFVPNPNTGDMVLHTENVNLISLRFRTVYILKNHFYISLDPAFDLHISHDEQQMLDNQSGLGLSLGIGKNIKINDALLLNIEPKLWVHNIVPFHKESSPYRLTTIGLNFGLVFGQKSMSLLR